MFPKDARIHEGDRVYFNDKKGIRHYGIACWAGRRAPMKRWRDDIMKIGIITVKFNVGSSFFLRSLWFNLVDV